MDEPTSRKPRVAVVFGGRSSEHVISCVTAGSVLRVLDRDRWDVVPVGIAPDGRWVLESGDTSRLRLDDPDDLPQVDGSRALVSLVRDQGTPGLVVTEPGSPPRELGDIDVVLPLLHGPWGEDGTLQGMLEMAGVRYVGAGVLASAVAMDKAAMKVVLREAGLPVMPSEVVTLREWEQDQVGVRARAEQLGFPLFVKPSRGGSSIGITKVHDLDELDAAITEAGRWDPKVLLEAFAEGAREVECGVLESVDGPPQASSPAEIRIGGGHEFYDFAAKYLPEEHTELDVPADLPAELVERLRTLAVRVFEVVGCEGLARVDFFVTPAGEVVVNELNTMPGFTPTSVFPLMWQHAGLEYPDLVDRLLQLALARGTGLR